MDAEAFEGSCTEAWVADTELATALLPEFTWAARFISAATAPTLTKRPTAQRAACSFINESMGHRYG